MDTKQLTPNIRVGTQPTGGDIATLANEGFKSIINLRTDGEDDQPISPADEDRLVRPHGLAYHHIPVSPDNIDAATVDSFRTTLDSTLHPVYVHCKSGARAATLSLVHLAAIDGKSGDEALQLADELGIDLPSDDLKNAVRQHTDRCSR